MNQAAFVSELSCGGYLCVSSKCKGSNMLWCGEKKIVRESTDRMRTQLWFGV